MQINLRKVLALLSGLAMLCTMLPLGALPVFAESGDLLTNGGFEDGATGWTLKYGEISTEAANGGTHSLKGTATAKYGIYASRVIPVVADSDYTVTFQLKLGPDAAATTQHRLYVWDEAGVTQITAGYYSDATADGWKTCTLSFNSGSYTGVELRFAQGINNAGSCYIDDVTMVGPVPSDDEGEEGESTFVTNGDFETGDLSGYLNKYNGTVQSDVVHGGSYAHKTTNTASKYQGMLQQNPISVVPNSDYTVTFWYYYEGNNAGGSASFYLYAQTTDNATNIKSVTSYPAAANTWYQVTHTFNSGDNDAIALVWSNRMANDGGTYYFDDIVMTGPAPDEGGDQPESPAPEGNETPSNDGYVINGDFETGDLTGWTVSKGGEVIYGDHVGGGNFSLMGTAATKYHAHVTQTVTVEANTNYVITFKAKLAASGGQIRFVVNGGGTRLNNDCYYFTSTTEWQTYQIPFNSGNNTAVDLVPTQGVTGGGNIYYDDIKMEKASNSYAGLYPQEMTAGADIRMMTYNVLVGQDTANGGYSWGSAITGRPEKACAMINYYLPDVIALEEFSGEWYDYFTENMTHYAFTEMTGADSQNNGKLYTCLAYNTDTIELVSTDLKRMTKSRWGTQGMRYLNIATFKVKATGEQFIACATHPDAGSLEGTQDLNGDGVAAEGDGYWRQFQLAEVADWLADLSATYQMPVLCGGDFNASGEETASYGHIVDAGYTDATAGRYIDHIFYNGMATHLYETTVADAAVSGASDHNAVFADIQFLDEYAIAIKDAKGNVKTQGRTYLKDGVLWLDYSASGVEFSANCEGKVALNLNVKSIKNTDATYGGLYFTVIVDGVKKERAACRVTATGAVELVLAEDLSVGNHTFEVYRQTEHRGGEVGISSLLLNGTLNDKPADNRLYIEFIGDSISTGYGALGNSSDSNADSPLWQDATVAYPYLTAQALNADFSDVCYSGLGCKYGYSGSLSMQTVYPLQRYQYDQSTKYGFDREPDVVVLALGTNDIANQTDAALRKAGYQEMLELVRAKNPNAKIVWICNMMKSDDNEMIATLIEENGGAAQGLFSLKLTQNTAGAGWHPSAAGQQTFADELVAFLNSEVLVRYVEDEITDEYDLLSYEGSSRMEMTDDKLGLAFLFQVKADGIQMAQGNKADLSAATVDVFEDGGSYQLLRMGAIVSNDPRKGMADMTLADVDNDKTKDVNATYLWDLQDGCARYAMRITNIPTGHETTMIYARAYYVFEYEGREITVYGDIQSANYVNKYDSNDGAFEW